MLWFRPRTCVRRILRNGGPIASWQIERGRKAMRKAARNLPSLPVELSASRPLKIHFLTGNRYWEQTAFCSWSLSQQTGRNIHAVVSDDGTLTLPQMEFIRTSCHEATFISEEEINDRLNTHLPVARFPSLRNRRSNFPLLRKITDFHVGSSGWKLFLDSDLLFFRDPKFLTEWHDNPLCPLRGEDLENAYGYPLEFLEELAGRPVDERINTGTLGILSKSIEWERMEFWCRSQLERFGSHYFQEQALVALHLAGQTCAIPPSDEYYLNPKPPEAIECQKTMHHYVADSKRWYFTHCWQRALGRR